MALRLRIRWWCPRARTTITLHLIRVARNRRSATSHQFRPTVPPPKSPIVRDLPLAWVVLLRAREHRPGIRRGRSGMPASTDAQYCECKKHDSHRPRPGRAAVAGGGVEGSRARRGTHSRLGGGVPVRCSAAGGSTPSRVSGFPRGSRQQSSEGRICDYRIVTRRCGFGRCRPRPVARPGARTRRRHRCRPAPA